MARSKLLGLSPTEFENLIFDLMTINGLKNVIWRTPGADGGRDIEGDEVSCDISGNIGLQKWYVECKRYSKSIDWPTLYGKIAYADNHNADFLLLCTTSNLSPNCKTEIDRWNHSRNLTKIRYWDGVEIDRRVNLNPLLVIKYGITDSEKITEASIFPLAQLTMKVVQASYGLSSDEPLKGSLIAAIEFSAALAELISERTETSRSGEKIRWKKFKQKRDGYSWLSINAEVDLTECDCYALRAILCAVRYFARAATIDIIKPVMIADPEYFSGAFCFYRPLIGLSTSAINAIQIILLWSNFEIELDETRVHVRIRRD